MYFVDYCNRHDIGVILDWVPAHFPRDGQGLFDFDGRQIYAAENWRQIVAVKDDGEVVGYTAVRKLVGWSSHVGDIQLMVGKEFRRSGLGTEMAKAIFAAARGLGVAKVIVEMLAVQASGRAIFERLGFSREGVFSKHAHDRHGNRHDLVVMAYHVM
jgi:RimJ/RimL family protein N-acetyltransferase